MEIIYEDAEVLVAVKPPAWRAKRRGDWNPIW